MISLADKFFDANRKLCHRLESYLPQAKPSILLVYEETVAKYMNTKPHQLIADVGGGNSCPFAKYKNSKLNTKIIAIDKSRETTKYNHDVDEKKVADITRSLPFAKNGVDIITSRWVLEHLEDTEKFIFLSQKYLKRGGFMIHLFACRFAPFSLLNQILPQGTSSKLLYFFNPKIKDTVGMPSFYHKCYYSAIRSIFEKYGLQIVEIKFSFYQSQYYDFFLPLFLISSFYEILIQTVGAKNMCAYILVIARKT